MEAGTSLILVTGATDGIGKETALALARRGADVLLHGRSSERVEAVRDQIEHETGRRPPKPLLADLASLAQVRELARELDARRLPLQVLLNNAGVYMNERRLTEDGFEMTMAVNHLAPFLLTHLLLSNSAGASLRRIVNVSSIAHTRGRLAAADVGGTLTAFDPYGHYAASKLANVLFTVALARRLQSRGVTVNSLHPGVVSTKLLTQGFGIQGPDSLEQGSATSVMLALDPGLDRVTGRYFAARKEARMNPVASDASLCRAFYENSAAAVGCVPLPPA